MNNTSTAFVNLDYSNLKFNIYTLKNAGLFQPKFGSNMDKPKCWVKNLILKNVPLEVKVLHFK